MLTGDWDLGKSHGFPPNAEGIYSALVVTNIQLGRLIGIGFEG